MSIYSKKIVGFDDCKFYAGDTKTELVEDVM